MATVLVTRPREESARTARLLRDRGHAVLEDPLLEVRDTADPLPDPAGFQAVACTSANGVRALARRTPLRTPPLYAVGRRTAEAARALGFQAVRDAGGDVGDIARLLAASLDPAAGPLLHASGTEVAGDLAGSLAGLGFRVERACLYEARPAAALLPGTQAALREGRMDAVLLFSPRTARTFVSLATDAGLDGTLGAVAALCLSARVAEAAAGPAWRDVRVAPRPDQESLLALLDG